MWIRQLEKQEMLYNSGNESQKNGFDQKRELQKCNETVTQFVVIELASKVTLQVIEAYVENNRCS